MSKSTYPRKESDLTVPIDRSQLPPISASHVASLGLDTADPEVRALITHNQDDHEEQETMVRCPACAKCELCKGSSMVTPARASAWHAAQCETTPRSEHDGK